MLILLDLRDTEEGCDIAVRAQPGARRTGIVGWVQGRLKIAVQAPALDGRANKAVCALVAEALGVAPSKVTVIRGETAREKTLCVVGMSAEQAAAKLPKREASPPDPSK